MKGECGCIFDRMRMSARVQGYVIIFLAIFCICIWYVVARTDHRGTIEVALLPVGDRTAVYIEAPSGRSVLIDSPDSSVIRKLSAVRQWWQRSIDIVIATSPSENSIGGLSDVLARYPVGTIIQSGVQSSAPLWNLFEKTAQEKEISIVTAKRGQVVDLGEGALLQILFPDRAAPGAAASEGCVVIKLLYGNKSFLLPCIATEGVQKYLVMLDGKKLDSDVVLLQGTIAPLFLGYVAPEYAVMTHDCEKSLSQVSLETAQKFTAHVLDTCDTGVIRFESDGSTVRRL